MADRVYYKQDGNKTNTRKGGAKWEIKKRKIFSNGLNVNFNNFNNTNSKRRTHNDGTENTATKRG
jgi:hypothetical protein